MRRAGHNLAQLNVGQLRHDPDDRRVRDFVMALDRINGLGRRMPGFVWMMQGSGEPNTGNLENPVGDDPRSVANLTVWEDVASLETFVWGTVHKQFYNRRAEWFETLQDMHFVMWWVPEGHRPTLAEALERLDHLRAHGDSDHAFGWAHAKDASAWRGNRCAPAAG
ncbi:DUF3291 domain-containing protein [Sulfitobacter sp. D35]|uniref:DUF3291 domain-containing protein n=1 Tax=Sulfitobacter sp. D35 TaxID=3083252 RepID=UPI00296EC419|nr:DUF3291 domain-containing protein [Sulfitobacter sp. D35]MDW4496892.1 DUF3291 domain-containing protein [Sulfitobacter sp. D35]